MCVSVDITFYQHWYQQNTHTHVCRQACDLSSSLLFCDYGGLFQEDTHDAVVLCIPLCTQDVCAQLPVQTGSVSSLTARASCWFECLIMIYLRVVLVVRGCLLVWVRLAVDRRWMFVYVYVGSNAGWYGWGRGSWSFGCVVYDTSENVFCVLMCVRIFI